MPVELAEPVAEAAQEEVIRNLRARVRGPTPTPTCQEEVATPIVTPEDAKASLVSGRQRSSGSPTCECITKLIDQEGVGSFTRYVNDCRSPPLCHCVI